MNIPVRVLGFDDADAALELYNQVTVGPAARDTAPFAAVVGHDGTRVFGAFSDEHLVSMATLHLLPNVLWNARPYGLVENVVTRDGYRLRGFGRAVMDTLIAAAWSANAYKIMLMTGQGRGALGFYEAVGFSSKDKFAMVLRRD